MALRASQDLPRRGVPAEQWAAGGRRKSRSPRRSGSRRFAVETLLYLILAAIFAFLFNLKSAPAAASGPARFCHWREWVGHDPVEPIDHYYQILEATGT
jgi:hypothetical protein